MILNLWNALSSPLAILAPTIYAYTVFPVAFLPQHVSELRPAKSGLTKLR